MSELIAADASWRSRCFAVAGRIVYAALFCLVLPALLVCWSVRLDQIIPLPPAIRLAVTGALIAAAGVVLVIVGISTLWYRGGGLPMNAFPPARLVATGIYAVIPHPIYLGFVLACAGCALGFGSSAGLFLITPLVALGSAALWWGFERDDVLKRFGTTVRPWISLPRPDDTKPSISDAIATMLLIFPLWLICYETPFYLGKPAWTLSFCFPAEIGWPVLPWTEVIYASAYLVPLALFLAPTRRDLRHFGIQSFLAIASLSICYLVLPVVSPMRPYTTTGPLAWLLDLERSWSQPPVAAFPSFHVLWLFLTAGLLARRSRVWGFAAWAWALAVAAACSTTGMHSLLDILAGGLAYFLLRHYEALYDLLLRFSQRLANSWRERRLGPVRIINHGFYAGAAGFTGILITAWLSGNLGWSVTLALAGLIAAAIWAQTVEGSPTLLRPFGYYGFVAGGLLTVGICFAVGGPALELCGAAAVAAPWVQAIGRLRCLVQGCCHGRAVSPRLGICVQNPHSRVAKFDDLVGVPIHPTQLYSIIGNAVIGLFLARLWSLQMPLSLFGGTYLILSGLARFVEETYRGERQTPVFGRLAIYHWMALGSMAAGCAITCLRSPVAIVPPAWPAATVWLAAIGGFVAFFLAMAVDFPGSRTKFARLSG